MRVNKITLRQGVQPRQDESVAVEVEVELADGDSPALAGEFLRVTLRTQLRALVRSAGARPPLWLEEEEIP